MCFEPLPEPTDFWKAFCDETCYSASVFAPAPPKPRRKRRLTDEKAALKEAVTKRQICLFDIEQIAEKPPEKKNRRTRKQKSE
jgi:hypothetical protein